MLPSCATPGGSGRGTKTHLQAGCVSCPRLRAHCTRRVHLGGQLCESSFEHRSVGGWSRSRGGSPKSRLESSSQSDPEGPQPARFAQTESGEHTSATDSPPSRGPILAEAWATPAPRTSRPFSRPASWMSPIGLRQPQSDSQPFMMPLAGMRSGILCRHACEAAALLDAERASRRARTALGAVLHARPTLKSSGSQWKGCPAAPGTETPGCPSRLQSGRHRRASLLRMLNPDRRQEPTKTVVFPDVWGLNPHLLTHLVRKPHPPSPAHQHQWHMLRHPCCVTRRLLRSAGRAGRFAGRLCQIASALVGGDRRRNARAGVFAGSRLLADRTCHGSAGSGGSRGARLIAKGPRSSTESGGKSWQPNGPSSAD